MNNLLHSQTMAILKALVLIYLFFAALFYLLSDFVIFQPPTPTPLKDKRFSLKIPLQNGKELAAVYMPNPQATYTFLFSHGNAEDLSTLFPFLQLLHDQGYSVFAYDYQGYGESTGKPSEKNTYADVLACYLYLTTVLKVPPETIIIFGRSLGTGPSIHLASLVVSAGLIVENPFVSAYRVQTAIPLFPFDKYNNLYKIPKVKAPVLVIHAKEDEIIPLWHGKAIYKAATSPKLSYWVEKANHNTIFFTSPENYWEALRSFKNFLNSHQRQATPTESNKIGQE